MNHGPQEDVARGDAISVYASKVYFNAHLARSRHEDLDKLVLLEHAYKSSDARFSIPMGSILFEDPFEDKHTETRY
jgi:hypothetical protein